MIKLKGEYGIVLSKDSMDISFRRDGKTDRLGDKCWKWGWRKFPIPPLQNKFSVFNPYPTAFLYGNGMVLHFYQQQESSTTKTVHKVINKGLKTYV